MKILISRISPSHTVGGAELSARDICRSLIKLGHKPVYMTNLRSSRALKDIPRSYIINVPLGRKYPLTVVKIIRPFVLISLLMHYLVAIIKFRPDVLSPQSRDDQAIATALGNIFSIPTIWRDPGDLKPQLSHEIKGILQKLNRQAQKKAIINTTAIFTLNEDERQYILKNIPQLDAKKISVIQSNILFDDYNKLIENKKSKGDKKKITIGYIARLEKHKGAQYLIKSFIKLQHKCNGQLTLLIAGDGSYKRELEKLAKDTSGIKFLGMVDDVSEVFNKIDIFVQPAEFEGWGRNIKEAKYFEKAIIASSVGGIKKQITHNQNGLLFNAGDEDALYKNLLTLIDNPEKRTYLSKNARKSALNEGDWIYTVEKEIIPLFEKYAKNNKKD